MVLSRILFFGVHVHSRNAEIVVLRGRETDLAAAILGAVQFDIGNPAFREALPDTGAHVLIIRIPGAVFQVELCFETFTRSAAYVRCCSVRRRGARTDCQSN